MPTKNQFTVIFVNNSSNAGNAAIYQNDPDIGVPNVQSLAWFSKFANPETQAAFGWEVNYSFVWSETGALAPGVHFLAAQDLKADLTNTNQVTLDFNGGYRFLDQESGSIPGNLYVVQNSSIPLRQASVGIGIGGSPVYAVQSQPNLNLVFSPKSKYFITFGNFQEGEVLDVGSITNPVELQFPPGVFSLTAVLNLDNTFTVIPTSQANTKLLAARKANPQISFSEALAA